MRDTPFFDGHWYCYANCVAMLLGSAGENISPFLIEPLTGVGLGAFMSEDGMPFFSGLAGEPDRGISKCLEILGFSFEENFSKISSYRPFVKLKGLLNESPVILGPLDMSYLAYNPYRPKFRGVDHFILAYKIEENKVFVNDPAGYLNVFIPFENLQKSWKAEAVSYRKGYYRYWAKPKRLRDPEPNEIYREAMNFFRSLYLESENLAKKRNRKIDEESIREISVLAKERKLKPPQIGFMSGFSLPLGAKRAFHFSQFFQNHNEKLSRLKFEQSRLFGQAHTFATQKDLKNLSSALENIADLELSIKREIVNI